MTTRSKVAETNAQIQRLRHHMFDECVAIASSIDTIPRAMVPRKMRDRWLRELRQATRAMALVKERLRAKHLARTVRRRRPRPVRGGPDERRRLHPHEQRARSSPTGGVRSGLQATSAAHRRGAAAEPGRGLAPETPQA
jgi:hypothetical protein